MKMSINQVKENQLKMSIARGKHSRKSQPRSKWGSLVVMAMVITLAMSMMGMALAFHTSHTMLDPFTQAELDTSWQADRWFPTDDVTSVSEFGRDDVARIGIDSNLTAGGGFNRTEGIKTVGVQDFGSSVQVDLYLDPAWENNAVRAGLWVAGAEDGVRNDWFGIIEFVNSEACVETECTTPQSNITDHEGFRIWDSAIGWTENLETQFAYGTWVTLSITLDTDANKFHYAIDGEEVGTAGAGGAEVIGEVFLNSYNFGLDNFPNLNSESYAAHWHAGIEEIDSKDECRDGDWEEAGFRNQGQCIRFVNTGKDSR